MKWAIKDGGPCRGRPSSGHCEGVSIVSANAAQVENRGRPDGEGLGVGETGEVDAACGASMAM